jgi:ankyrin repeat protein
LNADGFSPLHSAVKADRTEVVQRLIDKGADVNAKAKNGKTPLLLSEKPPEIRQMLIKAGAKEK